MKKYIKSITALTFLFTSLGHALTTSEEATCGCDHTISSYTNGSVNGNALNFQPGDTICLDPSVSYANMRWEDINGTKDNPIIIKNCAGQVYINAHNSLSTKVAYGWRFYESKFFKILGNGDPQHKYGIKVSTPGGFYISMERFTTNFEISNVEVAGIAPVTPPIDPHDKNETNVFGFAGIGIKTQPQCDGLADRDVWTMYDVNIHDNYIHDVGGEGVYIGYGRYDGFKNGNCDGNYTTPHAIRGLQVHSNRVENVGYDGVQIKNSDTNVAIYNNIIKGYGLRENGQHDEGLLVGDGTEALIYNNWIENGSSIKKGHGVQLNGFGNTHMFNNVVVNLGIDENRTGRTGPFNKKSSLYINNNSSSFSNDKNNTFKIYNNTFVGAQDHSFEAYTPQDIELKNNIFTGYMAQPSISSSTSVLDASNIYEQNMSLIGFVDLANKDFRLQHNSMAVGTGIDTQLAFDYNRSSRLNNVFDVGAYGYHVTPASEIPTLRIITPSTHEPIRKKAVFVEVELVNPLNIINKVQYVLNGKIIGTDDLPKVTEHWIGGQKLKPGNNEFYAIGIHNNGQITRSPSINIRVYL